VGAPRLHNSDHMYQIYPAHILYIQVTWAGPSPTLLIAMYVPMPLVDASALQAVYSSAALRDMPSSKWANLYLYTCTRIGCAVRVYGAEGEAMSANTKEIYLRRLGNELVRKRVTHLFPLL
jgi:hypothetical protein